MITPNLERLILGGQAFFKVHNHAFGMFGRIPVDQGKIAIITKIIWHPFLNPEIFPTSSITLNNDLFWNSEYQLKIDSKPGTNYYQFRNNLKYTYTGPIPFDMSTAMTADEFVKYVALQPGEPVEFDTFLMCSDYIKLTISRNTFPLDSLDAPVSHPVAAASEENSPLGVNNVNVLDYLKLVTLGANPIQYYNPAGKEYMGLPNPIPTDGKYREFNYVRNIADHDLLSVPALASLMDFGLLYFCFPLVTFHVVYVNKDVADSIIHS